jgi:protoporphyrin/coproporphyrin ferrochelatase
VSDDRVTVVLMAYGTPHTRDEILPYYTDIRRGRPPTPEQLHDLTARYEAIGGLSPLAARTEAQRRRLLSALDARAPGRFDVVLGLKHAAPRIEDAVASVTTPRIVGLVLAPHYSAFSVGQYHERARAAAAERGLAYTGIDSWHLQPAYLELLAADVGTKLGAMPPRTHVLFTAHSLPERILTTGDPYPSQLRATAEAIAARCALPLPSWSVAWQSAGRTPEPWLGPDVLTVIDGLDADGVLVCACGFVADHLEVLYDLDIEAAARAQARSIAFARTACVNDDPAVFAALADTVVGTLAP